MHNEILFDSSRMVTCILLEFPFILCSLPIETTTQRFVFDFLFFKNYFSVFCCCCCCYFCLFVLRWTGEFGRRQEHYGHFRLSDPCKDMTRAQMQTNAEAEHE